MDENAFWLKLWTNIGLIFLALIVSTHLYYGYKMTFISEMVKNGANPMDIRCLDAASNDPICLARK